MNPENSTPSLPDSFTQPGGFTLKVVILPVLFLLAALCSAQDMTSSARDLARKIGRQDIAGLTVRNASSLPESDAAEVKKTIETELRSRLQRPEGATVNITLSENLQGYLWVAEIQRGEERDVVMLNVARSAVQGLPHASLTIEKKLIWEQEPPILDVRVVGPLMMVLEPANLSIYREGQLVTALSISSGRPTSRDPRGRLSTNGDTFSASLPGVYCVGALPPSSSITCDESSNGMAAGRNYFTEPALPPFFSIATLSSSVRIIAGVDGRTHVYDGTRELGAFTGWGSDIAAVESGCSAGRQILASKPGEAGEPDAVQAYEWSDRRTTPAGDPVTFPGPVTALWASREQTVAVTRNSETGRYAAYSLAITCSR